ncbi:hypothetical protein, partial [Arcticibacter tournemirensis]|uniref:hypothetical protein n=1 Tax=Arcticibacter tournemirensis TaxID=699437 RepID=UPI001F48E52F
SESMGQNQIRGSVCPVRGQHLRNLHDITKYHYPCSGSASDPVLKLFRVGGATFLCTSYRPHVLFDVFIEAAYKEVKC